MRIKADDRLAIICLRSRPAPCTQWAEERGGVVPTGCDTQHYQVDVKMGLGIPHIDTPDQHYHAYSCVRGYRLPYKPGSFFKVSDQFDGELLS
jgi:hypothetical protein